MQYLLLVVAIASVAYADSGTLSCTYVFTSAPTVSECTTFKTEIDNSFGCTSGCTTTTTCSTTSTTVSFSLSGSIPSGTSCGDFNSEAATDCGSLIVGIFSENQQTGSPTGSCSTSSSTCFPASASVQLQDGTTKTMAQLEVGDKVLVAPNTYSEVYFFGHRLTDALVAFVKIATSNGNTLMLTSDHYLYVNGKLATAKTVKVGDSLIAADGSSIQVVEVSSEISTGLYNPHTMQGDIVVDGVITSTYTSSIAPSLAHAMLWPVRMLYSLGQNIVDGAFNEGSELISALLPNGKDAY